MQMDSRTTGEDTQLRDLAALDASGKGNAETAAWLRQPEMLDAWREALTYLVQDIQRQCASNRARVEAARNTPHYRDEMRRHASWNSEAARFRQSLETRLRECKRLQVERDQAAVRTRREDLASRIDALEFEVGRLRRSLQAVAEDLARRTEDTVLVPEDHEPDVLAEYRRVKDQARRFVAAERSEVLP